MDRHEIFSAWAPQSSIWSAWAKPVLFAHLHRDAAPQPPIDPPLPDISWAPKVGHGATLVLDLPGPAGVWMGLALAVAGYRPVPLYNACPDPSAPGPLLRLPTPEATTTAPPSAPEHILPYESASIRAVLVDVRPIMTALSDAAPQLKELSLPADAPPAFLIDSDRGLGNAHPVPGQFDNRSVSFPTDFPSANLLLNRGIDRAVLVQPTEYGPQADLAHTLRRWQEAGIRIELHRLGADGPLVPYVVSRPSEFRSLWHRLLVASGLRRNPLGGFGGMLPVPSVG